MVRPRLVQDNSMGQTLPVPPVRYGKDQPVTATTTHLDTTPADTGSNDGPDIYHIYCDNPNQALCGADITDLEETTGYGEQDCVVCTDLEKTHTCQNCGE